MLLLVEMREVRCKLLAHHVVEAVDGRLRLPLISRIFRTQRLIGRGTRRQVRLGRRRVRVEEFLHALPIFVLHLFQLSERLGDSHGLVDLLEQHRGVGRGSAWETRLRHLYMKMLTLRVAPNVMNEVFASCAMAIVGENTDEINRMQLPDDRFVRNLRPELGMLHRSRHVKCIQTDATPYEGSEFAATIGKVTTERHGTRDLTLVGAYELSSQTAKVWRCNQPGPIAPPPDDVT